MKFLLFLLFLPTLVTAQKSLPAILGAPSESEFEMKNYEKDTEAPGLILYDQGYNYFKVINGYVKIIKKYHHKTKVFDAKNFENETVKINLYQFNDSKEKIVSLVAYTHNGATKIEVEDKDIFTENEDENTIAIKFAFPNVKDGSILEYAYEVESPFIYNVDDWLFQNTLPTLYSEYRSDIPSNYRYLKKIYGSDRLAYKKGVILEKCFRIPNQDYADCESNTYVMRDVPAFKTERYMLSSKNYVFKINYALAEEISFYGKKTKKKSTWHAYDKMFSAGSWYEDETDQLTFFERNMPKDLFEIENDLEKAKAIFYYFQNHYDWNNYVGTNPEDIKKAFKNNEGSQTQINLSLYNGLKLAGFNPKIFLSSSRNNTIPDELQPLFTSLDYLSLTVVIDNKNYFLDASRKELPFGLANPKTINGKGRVINFNGPNYWSPVISEIENKHIARLKIEVDDDDSSSFNAKVTEQFTGYLALSEREELGDTNENDYRNEKEKHSKNATISEVQIENKTNNKVPLVINYDATFEAEEVGEKSLIYPFFFETFFDDNPFKLDERSYPIDFAYPITNTYIAMIDIKDKYDIISVPENKIMQLKGKTGSISVTYTKTKSTIIARLNFDIAEPSFAPSEYLNLKELLQELIDSQSNQPIILEKI
ncbi:hypothetical protein SCB49_01382 [unidentified eubacterium SCB49]|nr:hypothetical protein SCB49_01382 [unidentified eubacterium SCB49]